MLKAEDIVVWDILSRVGHGYDLEIVGLIRLLSVNWRMQTEAVDWHGDAEKLVHGGGLASQHVFSGF